jgi:hypothetical protein
MLALAGSGVATAGTCTYSAATNTENCDGAFTNIFPVVDYPPVADLTLVLGELSQTIVTPGGVLAESYGNINVISHADIMSLSYSGMLVVAYAPGGRVSLTNYGDISTGITSNFNHAVGMFAEQDVTLVNSGNLYGGSGNGSNVATVYTRSMHGDVSIDNQAGTTVTATSVVGNGYANAIRAITTYSGDITVVQGGSLNSNSVFGSARGIRASTYGASSDIDITVVDTGLIDAHSTNGFVRGMSTSTDGYGSDINIVNGGSISSVADGAGADGILAHTYGARRLDIR